VKQNETKLNSIQMSVSVKETCGEGGACHKAKVIHLKSECEKKL
jgi:hypothetical protein